MNVSDSDTDVPQYITYSLQLDEETYGQEIIQKRDSKICVLYLVFRILQKKVNLAIWYWFSTCKC